MPPIWLQTSQAISIKNAPLEGSYGTGAKLLAASNGVGGRRLCGLGDIAVQPNRDCECLGAESAALGKTSRDPDSPQFTLAPHMVRFRGRLARTREVAR